MLNPRQIEAFRAVIVTGGVTAAARALNVTQPAVTRLIRDLQSALGLELFARRGARLLPTAEALALYREVDRQFVGLERIASAARALRAGRAGTLRVAALPTFSVGFLPRLTGEWLAERPDLEMSLYGSITSQVADWVASGFCDVGFAQMPLDFPSLEIEMFDSVPAVAVMPERHPLARRAVLKPRDFEGEPFVSLEQMTQLRYRTDALFELEGVVRQIRVETPLSMIACALVAAGAGVSIVDPFTAAEYRGRGLAVRPFLPTILFDTGVVWSSARARSGLALDFAGRVRVAVADFAARERAVAARAAPQARRMTLLQLLGFCALTGFAAWVQTVTGFAFALITVGGVALTGLMSLPDAAALVSALSFVNAAQMVATGWRHIARRQLALVLATSLPMVVVGFHLLSWLSATRADALRLVLAAAIVLSSLQLAAPPKPGQRMPGAPAFLLAGAMAGMLGGLFSASGPPLAWRFWRTPLPVATIRETLVATFALNAALRLALVVSGDFRPAPSVWLGLVAAPAVMIATAAARRWPPPLAPTTLRRIVFVLLLLAGLSLGAPALMRMIG